MKCRYRRYNIWCIMGVYIIQRAADTYDGKSLLTKLTSQSLKCQFKWLYLFVKWF